MVVHCGQCAKAFLLPDDRIKTTGTRVRCKKCGHEFVVMPAYSVPAAEPSRTPQAPTSPGVASAASWVPSLDPALEQTQSGGGTTPPPDLGLAPPPPAADVSSSYEITFKDLPPSTAPPTDAPVAAVELSLESGGPPEAGGSFDVPPPPPESPAETSGMKIDFDMLGDVADAPPTPTAPMQAFQIAPPPDAPPSDAADFQLDSLALDEPPPEEPRAPRAPEFHPDLGHAPMEPSSPGPPDPLAGLDLDFTLDDKAMGGGPAAAPPAETTEASPAFESTSLEEPPPLESSPAPTPSSASLKAEFDSLGRDDMIKGNLEEMSSPEPMRPRVAFAAPSTPFVADAAARESVRTRAGEKDKKVFSFRPVELRSPIWLSATAWVLIAGLCASTILSRGFGLPGSDTRGMSSSFDLRGSLRSAIHGPSRKTDIGPHLTEVRGRMYQNVYGESFYLVTGFGAPAEAKAKTVRMTLVDRQGWKIGEAEGRWIAEVSPREFALLRFDELLVALDHLGLDISRHRTREVPFVAVYLLADRMPDRFIVDWAPSRDSAVEVIP